MMGKLGQKYSEHTGSELLMGRKSPMLIDWWERWCLIIFWTIKPKQLRSKFIGFSAFSSYYSMFGCLKSR